MLYADHVAPFLRFDDPLPNMLYAFGGRNHRQGSLDAVEMLDTWHGRWVHCPPMPARRAGGGAAVLPDGRLIVTGGYDERGIVDGLLDRVDIFDPARRCWEEKGAAPLKRARWGHGCAALGGLVYVVGGCSLQPGSREPREASMETLRSCEAYSLREDVWRPAAPLQVARSGSRVVALGDRHLLAVGGCDDVFGRAEMQPTAELFDASAGHWAVLRQQLAQPRTTAGVAVLDARRVIVFGGAPSLSSAEVYSVPLPPAGQAPDVPPAAGNAPGGEPAAPGAGDAGASGTRGSGAGLSAPGAVQEEVARRLLANLPGGRMGCQAAALSLPADGGAARLGSDRLCIVVVGGERCIPLTSDFPPPRVQQFASVPVFDVVEGAWVPPERAPVPPLPSPRTAVALCVGAGRVATPPAEKKRSRSQAPTSLPRRPARRIRRTWSAPPPLAAADTRDAGGGGGTTAVGQGGGQGGGHGAAESPGREAPSPSLPPSAASSSASSPASASASSPASASPASASASDGSLGSPLGPP